MKIIINRLHIPPCKGYNTFKTNTKPSKLNEIWNKYLAGELYKFSKRALYLSTYSDTSHKDNNIGNLLLYYYNNDYKITIKIDKENILELYLMVEVSEFDSNVWFNYYYFNDGIIDMNSFITIKSNYNINDYEKDIMPKDSIELCVSGHFNDKQFVVINPNIAEENLEDRLNKLAIIDLDIYHIKYLNIYYKINNQWWTFDTAKAYYKSAKRLCFADKYMNHINHDLYDINSIPKFVGKYKCTAIKRDSNSIEFYFDELGDDVYVRVLFKDNNIHVIDIISKNKRGANEDPAGICPYIIEPYEIFDKIDINIK